MIKFWKQHKMYESDHTQFIKNLKETNPTLEEKQREGRALLWDRAPLPLNEQQRLAESRVKQQAYVYQSKH